MNCLCCGNPLPDGGSPHTWHSRCSQAFFGTTKMPQLEISSESLELVAQQAVSAGQTVTGVQRKLSIHLSRDGRDHRLTLVGYPAGFILKPVSPEYPRLPEFEYLTMSMAQEIGISTVPHGLITMKDGTRAYITRRIDRRFDKPHKIPMEDFCQLSERLTEDKYRGSYEHLAKILSRYSSRAGLDLSELFLLLVFCFVTGNADMHLKNFSLYRPKEDWVLAPAYDLLPSSVVLPEDPEETALTLNGKKGKLVRNDFETFGTRIGLNPKAVSGLIDFVIDSQPRFIALLEDSTLGLLPGEIDNWKGLMKERSTRLG